MSASQLLGAVAGVVVGVATGSPQAGFMTYSAVSGVGAYLDQPDRIGPRLEDLRIQMSQYGATIPFEWGTNRHAGTIIWPRVLEAVENRTEESSKGGPDNVTFSYTLSCAVLVCEGPIAGIRRIWANKKIVYDISEDNGGATMDPGGVVCPVAICVLTANPPPPETGALATVALEGVGRSVGAEPGPP